MNYLKKDNMHEIIGKWNTLFFIRTSGVHINHNAHKKGNKLCAITIKRTNFINNSVYNEIPEKLNNE